MQEDLGVVRPSFPSAAYAASDMTGIAAGETCIGYDRENMILDWCGSTVVGFSDSKRVSYAEQWLLPVMDSLDTGDNIDIPDFGGGLAEMRAFDVSVDGAIMVGYGQDRRGAVGFRADMTDPMTDPLLPPTVDELEITDALEGITLQNVKAYAVSEDGNIIVGTGSLRRGNRGFITTVLAEATDTEPIVLESYVLPVLGGGGFAEAYALATAPDGVGGFLKFVAGKCDSPQGVQACIWYEGDNDVGERVWLVKALGSLAPQSVDSEATGIAYRPGSLVGDLMVIGRSRTNLYASEAFVWTGNPTLEEEEIGYFYDLEYILTKTGVGEASSMGSDWVLTEVNGVSAAGDRIVGWGINPEGGDEAFVVTGYPYDELIFTHE